jgi:hypothetical protein
MTFGHEYTEWHLTPRGWDKGKHRRSGGILMAVPPPDDRVLTVTKHGELATPFSKARTYVTTDWECDDRELINSLLARFGNCPD